jgi:hypothetical protein
MLSLNAEHPSERPSLQSETRQMHLPLTKYGNILLSSVFVITRDTREQCRDMIQKPQCV